MKMNPRLVASFLAQYVIDFAHKIQQILFKLGRGILQYGIRPFMSSSVNTNKFRFHE